MINKIQHELNLKFADVGEITIKALPDKGILIDSMIEHEPGQCIRMLEHLKHHAKFAGYKYINDRIRIIRID